MQENQNNKIYEEQFLLLAFISVVTFKIVMLPQYFIKTASNNSYMIMAYLIAVEIMMLAIVYGIVKNGSLLEQNIPKWLKGIFALLVFSSSVIKATVLGSEGVAYIATSLYDNVSWTFVTLALLLTCVYLAQKGGKVIARSAQLFFWIIAFAMLFYLIFSNLNLELLNLMPFKISGDLAVAGDKYLIWFGDFTPLLFVSVTSSRNRGKKRLGFWTAAAVVGTLVCTVGLMVIFISTFGDAGQVIGNAFLNVSSLNRISFMIGSADLPTVLSWLVMCVIKFSLLLFAMTECAKFFFGKKAWVSVICGVIIYFIICYGIGNLKTNYDLATSWLRYFAFFAEFIVTIAAYIAMRICEKKNQNNQPSECNNADNCPAQTDQLQGEI